MKHIGNKIRVARQEAGLSMGKLAALVGMSRQGLSYVERHGSKLSTLVIIADALNLDIIELIGENHEGRI